MKNMKYALTLMSFLLLFATQAFAEETATLDTGDIDVTS